MSESELVCPACSTRLKQPAALRDGARFQCPKCAAKFRIRAAESRITVQKPPLPEAELVEPSDEGSLDDLEIIEEGEARPAKRKMKESQRMKLVYKGLGLHYVKFVCVIAAMLLAGLFSIGRSLGWGEALSTAVNFVSIPVSVSTPLIGLTGALLCFWVPKRSRARLLIQISFGLDVGALLAQGLGAILMFLGGTAALAAIGLTLMGSLATLGACILFMLFLRALASYLGDRGAESEATEVMVRWLVMTVVAPLVLTPLVALTALGGRSVFLGVFRLVFIGGIYLTYLVFYFKVLMRLLNLIAAIRERIASRYDLD
jgi:hypothetical protein